MSTPVAYGCEISGDRQHGAIFAAGRSVRHPSKIRIERDYYQDPAGMVLRLDELYMKHDPVAVVLDPRSQSVTLIHPLAEAGIIATRVGPEDVAAAHGEFLDLVNGQGIEHLDEPELTAAVRASQQRPLSGAQAWERKGIAVDQSPLVAATLACWAFRRWEELSQPGAFVL